MLSGSRPTTVVLDSSTGAPPVRGTSLLARGSSTCRCLPRAVGGEDAETTGCAPGTESALIRGSAGAADRSAMRDRAGGVEGEGDRGSDDGGTIMGSSGDGERGADAGAVTDEGTITSYGDDDDTP